MTRKLQFDLIRVRQTTLYWEGSNAHRQVDRQVDRQANTKQASKQEVKQVWRAGKQAGREVGRQEGRKVGRRTVRQVSRQASKRSSRFCRQADNSVLCSRTQVVGNNKTSLLRIHKISKG